MPPINDDIANATDLGTDPDGINISGTNITATYDAFEAAEFYDQPSVWYKFVLTTSQTLNFTITKTGSDPDWEPYAEIYEDTVPGTPNFSQLVDDYREYVGDTSHTPTEGVFQGVFPAGAYYVSVTNWNFDGSTDDFDFALEAAAPPPVNDLYNNRIFLDSKYAVSVEGTTEGATFAGFGEEPNVDPGGLNDDIPTVWYQWTAPNYGNEPLDVTIEAVGSGDYYVELITGNPFGFTIVDTAHNAPLTVTGVDGFDVLKIRVSSPVAGWADFDLNIDVVVGGSPPSNDDWASAEVLSGYTDTASGTTVGATGQYAEVLDDDYSFEQTNTVWYKYTPPQTGRLILYLDSDFDLMCFVWRGASLETLDVIKDVSHFVNGFRDYTTFTVEAGHDYYFQIQGWGGEEGTFDIELEMSSASAPANDEPANAVLITTDGTFTTTTEGANWDSTGPYEGHFVDRAWESTTIWYKIVAESDGSFIVNYNNDVHHSTLTASDRTYVTIWRGSLSDEIQLIQVAEPDHPSIPFTGEIAIEGGVTYWIALNSSSWSDSIDIDYELLYESEESFEPTGTGQFDSETGFFVWDEEDGEYVSSGSVGYGTIEPWSSGHYPYGWWTRFYLRSTSGEYLYRYGQTQQFIECFRATKTGGTYHSLVVIGHRNGTQTLGIAVNGTVAVDTDYKVWGLNRQGTTGRVRIELGENGLTVDGRNLVAPSSGYFVDSSSDQFVEFDYGIRTYPSDGTATVDLDPEWDMRYSAIVLHDNPERNVVGQLDPALPEVTQIAGFTYGTLLADSDSFNIITSSNNPAVVASSGDYDGYSIDCSETGTANVNPCGVQWVTASNPFLSTVTDTYYPGFSFRFWVETFPTRELIIASIVRTGLSDPSSEGNGTYLVLSEDGTLSIKPSYDSALIPFCTVSEGTWNYIELQADTHQRQYSTKIWLQNVYMGNFVATTTGSNTTRIPNKPPYWNGFILGRIGDPLTMFSGQNCNIPVEIEYRDIAITRHKHDRPIGPSIVIPMTLNETGEHSFGDPMDIEPNPDSEISFNGDFSLGTDGYGQPHYWTGIDRHDYVTPPAGAMYLGYLFQTFPDSAVTITTDGSGPPGHTGENAMRIEATETVAGAAYVFGGASEPAVDLHYDIEYSDTICCEFWVKGIAGQEIEAYTLSGIGGWPNFNTHVMDGTWERVRLFVVPVAADDGLSAIVIRFPDATTGDVYLIKDFHAYINIRDQPPIFFETGDGGTTTTEILTGDTTSHEKIDEFPPSGSDQIYLSTTSFNSTLRGDEDDLHTHLPPDWGDDYVEYVYGEYHPDDGEKVLGAKLLLGLSGYNGVNPQNSPDGRDVDFTALESGITHVVISDGDDRRYTGEYTGNGALFGVSMPLPPSQGEWTINRWNEFLLRFGFHDTVFQNSQFIIADFSDGGVVQGVAGELLTYDRRLSPPNCVRPIDLSRIRFRAWEDADLSNEEEGGSAGEGGSGSIGGGSGEGSGGSEGGGGTPPVDEFVPSEELYPGD